jgi:hypothetical protein
MDKRIEEAVELFQQVLIYGTERVFRSEDPSGKNTHPNKYKC